MSGKLVRVGLQFQGAPHWYQRESEVKRDGRWVSIPYVVNDKTKAITMSESAALILVQRLRDLGEKSAWIEALDGHIIDVPQPTAPVTEDTRVPVMASLAQETGAWYVVRPANRPAGPCYFVKVFLPNRQPEIIYAESPIACLEKADRYGWLSHCEPAPAPEVKQEVVEVPRHQRRPISMLRPGDR